MHDGNFLAGKMIPERVSWSYFLNPYVAPRWFWVIIQQISTKILCIQFSFHCFCFGQCFRLPQYFCFLPENYDVDAMVLNCKETNYSVFLISFSEASLKFKKEKKKDNGFWYYRHLPGHWKKDLDLTLVNNSLLETECKNRNVGICFRWEWRQ